jgi:transcriptional regulator with XRE-family HTH domain
MYYRLFIQGELIMHPIRLKTPSQSLIQEMISQQGYNQSRIARETGISRRTLNNMYNGRTADPTYRIFRRLLALYCQLFFLKNAALK